MCEGHLEAGGAARVAIGEIKQALLRAVEDCSVQHRFEVGAARPLEGDVARLARRLVGGLHCGDLGEECNF